ncbi:MAG: ribbon-helix-helix protein, CopG family [Candidatus Babeliales bacterium]|jgi:hypothetical protein
MHTKKLSLTLQLDKTTVEIITQLAQRETKSIPELIQTLIEEALEDREDRALSALAAIRDS